MQGDHGAPVEAVGYSAFISHASEDRKSAEAICQGLEAAGFRCWIAPRDVRPGEIYLEEIIRGIELSKCLVLVLSNNANQAHMVRDEVERAYNKGKPIFPVRIEEVLPARGLELLVSTAHWIDAWRGNLPEHIAKLVLRLAEEADVIAELPPELQRRIRWRRWARLAGILTGSAAIAVLVGLIMRSTLTDNTKDLYNTPPSVSFSGSPVSRLKAGVAIRDGYDQDGTYEIFKNPLILELFDVNNGVPEEFFKSTPQQFAGAYQHAPPFDIEIPGLPARVVSCLSYDIVKTNKHEAILTGFSFDVPGSQGATSGITSIGPTEIYPVDAKSNCAIFVQNYITKHLKDLKPLTERRTMASLANIGTWRGDCRRDNNVTALLFCSLITNSNMMVGARQLQLGFTPSDLSFVFDADTLSNTKIERSQVSGSIPDRVTVSLPNLGPAVYASWEYQDGSRGDVKQIGVAPGGSRTTAVTLRADGTDAPALYVAFRPHYLPDWGVVVMDARGAAEADWSRDGRGFTRMDGKYGAFFTILTPSAFGIAEPKPPPLDGTKGLWLKFVYATGQSRVYRYPVDLWRIARDALRASQPPETVISCSENPYPNVKRDTQGALKVLCRFPNPPNSVAAPGLLFQKIWWGLGQEELHDLDDFGPSFIKNEIDQLTPTAQRIDVNSLFHSLLRSWRECFLGPCNGAGLALFEDASTVFFKFRYWDGKETDIVAVPVK